MRSLGIDVGGANLKFSNDRGEFGIKHLPIWKDFGRLEEELKRLRDAFDPDVVGVVMTAELSDVFRTKVEGVLRIAELVVNVFGDSMFLDLNGRLRDYGEVMRNPREFMASNWVASARFLLEEGWRNFIFADMGSTTTDLIPVTDGIEAGRTDYERLKRGELLYFGVLRTPVFYILPEFDVPLVPEFFAIAGDVFVVTGDLKPEEYTCETPDGRGKDVENCMRRLARCVCADLEEVGEDYVRRMAEEFKRRTIEILECGMRRISNRFKLGSVLGCGIGEFLIKTAAERCGLKYVSIGEVYGKVSAVFPAYATARIVKKYYLT